MVRYPGQRREQNLESGPASLREITCTVIHSRNSSVKHKHWIVLDPALHRLIDGTGM